jgi:hypothetical protein
MLARGDNTQDIAIWFGLHGDVVELVGLTHQLVEPAPLFALPPAGPYSAVTDAHYAVEHVRAAERECSALLQMFAKHTALNVPTQQLSPKNGCPLRVSRLRAPMPCNS